MRTAVVALTLNGGILAEKLGKTLHTDVFTKQKIDTDFPTFTAGLFKNYQAIIFIMACGIVVRAIAPLIKGKDVDPAVVVVDEKGKFAISLLSGHIGGANKLAKKVADITGGTPVITTSTDVNGVIAFDEWAKENDCAIENLKVLKFISGELVNGRSVGLVSDFEFKNLPDNIELIRLQSSEIYENRITNFQGSFLQKEKKFEVLSEKEATFSNRNITSFQSKMGVVILNRTDVSDPFEKALYLRPRNLILGLGCRRGTSKEAIDIAVNDFLKKNKRSFLSVKRICSIDLKADENGIIEFCKENNLEFITFTKDEIEKVEGEFIKSEFVKENVGVDGVAEPCAVKGGINAKLICPKTIYKGITLALAEEERFFSI